MTTPQMAGQNIPDTMWKRGEYRFIEQETVRDGNGLEYGVGVQSIRWSFANLTWTEMDFLLNTVLQGNLSRTTTFKLWTNTMRTQLQDFTSGVIYRPSFEESDIYYDLYHNVVIEIEHLLPILPVPQSIFTVGSSDVDSTDLIGYP